MYPLSPLSHEDGFPDDLAYVLICILTLGQKKSAKDSKNTLAWVPSSHQPMVDPCTSVEAQLCYYNWAQ